MVEPPRIELGSPRLQRGAITRLAQAPKWQGNKDLNPVVEFWRLPCYLLHHSPADYSSPYSLSQAPHQQVSGLSTSASVLDPAT